MSSQTQQQLVIAAAEIRRAIESCQRDIQEKRKELDRLEHDIKRKVQDIRSDITRTQSQITNADNDTGDRAALLGRVQNLEGDVAKSQKELNDARDAIKGDIRFKENQIKQFTDQANEIESKSRML